MRVGKVAEIEQPAYAAISAVEWYQAKFQKTLVEIEDHFSKYRLSDALMTTYKLIWDDFLLLAAIGNGETSLRGAPIDKKTYEAVVAISGIKSENFTSVYAISDRRNLAIFG